MAKHKPILPMSAIERAKQFAPFSPLHGLHKALQAKEKIRVPRKIIPEDRAEELNRALRELQCGQLVTVVYYDAAEQEYIQLTGIVTKIDLYRKELQIVTTSIAFEDITEVIVAE